MFQGYLIKILAKEGATGDDAEDYIFPENYIVEKSYKATYSVMDSDSKRVASGRLKRTALKHKVLHCTVQLRPMSNTDFWSIWKPVRDRYVIKKEKKVKASIWVQEINNYVEAYYYNPDIEFPINHIEGNKILYDPIEIEFIGY